MKNLKLPPMF